MVTSFNLMYSFPGRRQPAPPEVLQKLTYLVLRYHNRIPCLHFWSSVPFCGKFVMRLLCRKMFKSLVLLVLRYNLKLKYISHMWIEYMTNLKLIYAMSMWLTSYNLLQINIELPEDLPPKETREIGESYDIMSNLWDKG